MNIIPPYTKWFSGFSIPGVPSPVTPTVASGQILAYGAENRNTPPPTNGESFEMTETVLIPWVGTLSDPHPILAKLEVTYTVEDWGDVQLDDEMFIDLTSTAEGATGSWGGHTAWTRSNSADIQSGVHTLEFSYQNITMKDLMLIITRFSVLLLNLSVVCLAGCVAANEETPSEAVAERGIKMHGNNVNVYLGDASIFLNTVRKAERIRIGFATRHLGCDADTFAYDVSPTEFLAIQQAFLDSKTVYDEEYWIARDYDLDVDKSSRTRRDGPYIAVLFCDQNGNTLRSLRIELISDHQGTTFDYYSGKEVPEFWVVMTESHFRAVMHIVEKYRRISSALNQD